MAAGLTQLSGRLLGSSRATLVLQQAKVGEGACRNSVSVVVLIYIEITVIISVLEK